MNMKKYILCLSSVMICVLCACGGDDDNNNASTEGQANIELKDFANSGCKSYARTRTDDETWVESFEYSCLHENYLYVKHNNAIFNCCPGEFKADINVVDNTITISEWSTEDMCDCICAYDLSYEIGPLVEGKSYIISIGHRGVEQQIAEFTFRNSMSGVWGVPSSKP